MSCLGSTSSEWSPSGFNALLLPQYGSVKATNLQAFTAWTFPSECPIPDDLGPPLLTGETPIAAYRTIRDSAVFTTKRLIIRDAQGLTGNKIKIGKRLDVHKLDSLIAQAVIG